MARILVAFALSFLGCRALRVELVAVCPTTNDLFRNGSRPVSEEWHLSHQSPPVITSLKRCAEVVDAPGEGGSRRPCP
jgi:hypothetical protein